MKLLSSLFDAGTGAGLLAVTAAGAFAPESLNTLTQPFLGTTVVALVSAWLGAAGAFAYYGEPVRRKMLLMVLINGALACTLVSIAPLYFGWDWLTPETKKLAEPPLAFITAFLLRWAVPLVTEIGPQWVRNKYGAKP